MGKEKGEETTLYQKLKKHNNLVGKERPGGHANGMGRFQI